MSKAEQAAGWIERIAADNAHGYAWGGWGPDYDCGHLVIKALESAGIPAQAAGATYTGNLPEALMRCGAKDVTKEVSLGSGVGMRRGDVLVNRQNHAAMYVGNGMLVQARSNYDGVPGDSSGNEIRKQPYYNYPWTHVLRFAEDTNVPTTGTDVPDMDDGDKVPCSYCAYTYNVAVHLLRRGNYGPQVSHMQQLLKANDYDPGEIDGDFGAATEAALRAFQADAGITVDGEWGGESFDAMWNY